MPEVIALEGYRELSRAFLRADKLLSKELRKDLREAAEPVRSDAERLAVSGIPHIGLPWSRMRVGVTQKEVYVAPRQRGRNTAANRKRPNLAPLLMNRSMLPALERNQEEVVAHIEMTLDLVGRAWEVS